MMGKLEHFQRNRSDIQYLKDNDWTKEEVIKQVENEFKELLTNTYDAYQETLINIAKVYNEPSTLQD